MSWPATPTPGRPPQPFGSWPPPGRPPTSAGRIARWTAVWGVGVVALLLGTFLPWLYSGRIAKNSYQLADVGLRRLEAPGWLDGLLVAWPFLGPLWAVAVVLLILRRRRLAAILSIALAAVTFLVATGGVVVALRVSSTYLGGSYPGPVLTAVGALIVLVSSSLLTRSR